jgi:hypothetical protein
MLTVVFDRSSPRMLTAFADGTARTWRVFPTPLVSAFPSSRRVNLWIHWKRLLQALAGKAGGTAVMTTVDHTLMRGSIPHDR